MTNPYMKFNIVTMPNQRKSFPDEKICRLCLANNAEIYVFENDVVLDCIMVYFQLEVHRDEPLPDCICFNCMIKIEDISKFIKQCHINDKKLRQKFHSDNISLERDDENTYMDNDSTEFNNEEMDSFVPDKIESGELDDDKLMETIQISESGEEYLHYLGIKIIVNRSKTVTKVTKPRRGRKLFFCDICGEMKSRNHRRIHLDESGSCNICHKILKSKSQLKSHMVIHSDARPFKCNLCEMASKTNSGLRKHMRHVHEEPTVLLTCEYCPKMFKSKSTRDTHVKIHTGEKNYQCDHCPYRVISKQSLVSHIRTHTKEKPYPCKICEKTFATAASLLEHVRLHLGVKLYECPICKKGFVQLGNMKSHFRHNHKGEKFVWIPLNEQRKMNRLKISG